jgi:hypothetical protein
VAQKFAAKQDAALFTCTDCWRLPSAAWLWADALTGAAALVSLWYAAFLYYQRERSAGGTPRDERRRNNRKGIRHFVIGASALVGLLAVTAAVVRHLGARGYGSGWVTAGSWIQVAGIALVLLIVVAIAANAESTELGPYTFVRRVTRFIARQRVNVVGLVLLAIALMFLGQTSGQAVDSIRTWGVGSAHGVARLGFGVGAALLLSFVVYEAAVQLTQVSTQHRGFSDWPVWPTLAGGGVLIAVGVLLVVTAPFGLGPIVVGALLCLLGVLDLPNLTPRDRSPVDGRAARDSPGLADDKVERLRQYDARVAEFLALVPLLLFAATGVAAAIDAALSRGKGEALGPLLPTLILAVVAVFMTGEVRPSALPLTTLPAFVIAFGVVFAAALLLDAGNSEAAAAVVAVAGCVLAFVYVYLSFWRLPRRAPALALPAAAATGIGVFLATHADPFGSANTIGTLAVVSIGVAFWLGILNWLIYGTYWVRPPRTLWFIGFQRLPIITLVVIAWIGAGAILTPPTLHEARLTERQTVNVDGKDVIVPAATLTEAFDAWVEAQPELAPGGQRGRPVPMLLVAAHGGGIRAAYWPALALDCIVGYSAAGFDPSAVRHGNDKARMDTCKTSRRTPQQQRDAARHIFLASGVSGGAFGLYAYARQLIAQRSLGDGSWVNKRLARDFASATIGWGLFHDATAHWFGLNSHRGGGCQWKIFSRCMTADRAAILEETFDRAWPAVQNGAFAPRLRVAWDMRASSDEALKHVAQTIPLLLTNTTVTGGKARGVVSAANLGTWPMTESHDPGRGNFDAFPLAGTVEVVEAMCATKDIRLSTAALLAARFPYVSPAGHVSGQCRRVSKQEPLGADASSACAHAKESICEMRLVDGGYAENSGLFTIDALWPSLRQLVIHFNSQKTNHRKIAPVIVELDNHYQAALDPQLAARGSVAETLVPLATAFGARNAQETFARALAYRLRPPGCTITISPGLHPGLTAPLGWELSSGARDDLVDGLTRPHPTALGEDKYLPVLELRRLQQWLGGGRTPMLHPPLATCIPKNTPAARLRP